MNKTKTAVMLSTTIEIVQLISGIVILLLFGLCTIMALFDADLASDGFLQICLVLDAIGVVLIFFSRKRNRLVRLFKDYVTILSNDPTGSIANLAAATGSSVDVVRKNLDQMIKKKYFSNAAIDQASDCILFLNRNVPRGFSAPTADNASTVTGRLMSGTDLSACAPAPVKITVTCKSCGGVNTLIKGQTGECEYCGSVIQG